MITDVLCKLGYVFKPIITRYLRLSIQDTTIVIRCGQDDMNDDARVDSDVYR